MTIVFWTLLGFYLLIISRWLWGYVELSRTSMDHMSLPAHPAPMTGATPRLTVLIAAHNEGEHIADCLNRLREQNYPLAQIIVINDRSKDATGEVVARMARDDNRITLVEVNLLPDGWIGKTHALAMGAARATGEYLLFLDSDVTLQPGAIAAVMHKAVEENIDFLTLWPRLGLRSLADRMLVPPIGWVLSVWSWGGGGAKKAVDHPIMGNGQFLLVRREAYDRIGGHGAVRAELAEDAMLASNAARADLRRWVGFGTGLYVASRNSTFQRCANGLARVIIGSLVVPWKVVFSTQIILGGCVLPFWAGPLALLLWYNGTGNPLLCGAWAVASAIHIVGMFLTLRRLFKLTMEERGSVWLFPLGCVAGVGILVWSLLIMSGRGTIRWGATRYTVRGSQILNPIQDAVSEAA